MRVTVLNDHLWKYGKIRGKGEKSLEELQANFTWK